MEVMGFLWGIAFNDGHPTALSVTLVILGTLFWLYKYNWKDDRADIIEILMTVKAISERQLLIENKQIQTDTHLAIHTKESFDNTTKINAIKDDISKVEGMLSIMGLNTSRGIK